MIGAVVPLSLISDTSSNEKDESSPAHQLIISVFPDITY